MAARVVSNSSPIIALAELHRLEFQRGSLREQALGRYSINDNFGFQRGDAQPRSFGYQIFGGW